jgi:biopolymer transport protein ExbD
MHLAIMRDAQLYFGSGSDTPLRRIDPEQLAAVLRATSKDTPEKTVYLQADARCRYGDVEAAVDGVRAAGLTKVVLLMENLPVTPKLMK